jgi:hypothetical protein
MLTKTPKLRYTLIQFHKYLYVRNLVELVLCLVSEKRVEKEGK